MRPADLVGHRPIAWWWASAQARICRIVNGRRVILQAPHRDIHPVVSLFGKSAHENGHSGSKAGQIHDFRLQSVIERVGCIIPREIPMPVVASFLKTVLRSGLFSREQLKEILRTVPEESRSDPL